MAINFFDADDHLASSIELALPAVGAAFGPTGKGMILLNERNRKSMRQLAIALAACIFATSSFAAPPKGKGGRNEQSLQEFLQGKWARRNHPFSWEIVGKNWVQFIENKPGQPDTTGVIEFPPGKDYAVVKEKNGHVIWLFPAGENALGVETFVPNGSIQGDGRVFYRPSFVH